MMHKYLNEYPQAPKDRIEEAVKIFPYKKISAEEYAAKEGHGWLCFSFGNYIYPDKELNEWIHTLDDILFTPEKLKELRIRYLTPKEKAKIEKYENNP